jgi:glycosyltransferase involved in cell wall biosynthesis
LDKIKVLQVNKLYAPHIGGVEKVVQDIAEGLNDRVDMKVLVCQTKGKTAVEQINGVEVTRAGSLGIFFSMPLSFSFFFQLRKLSKDQDIVHFHMPFPLGDAAFFLSGFKGKVILWWHSDIIRQKTLMKVYKPVMQRFLQRADCIVVATEGHINGSKYLLPYRDKCVIIPFGINVQSLFSTAEKISSQNSSGINRMKNILFIGRLIYYKGADVLLDAFSHVHGAKLRIAGDGPLRTQLEEKAKDLNINEHVEFMGHLEDSQIKKLLSECDMLVLPSVANSEAFGIVQLEAMAFSKPVINTSLPTGVPYVSINEQTGLTVPPGDAASLGIAIQRLIDNDDERIQMGIKARDRVMKNFKLNDMLDNIFKLYQNVLK